MFWQGLLLGLAIAAPVGAIGVLCIQRTLLSGRIVGFVSGLGAATADALYGCVAALGLGVVADFLTSRQQWLQVVGGFFLLYLAVKSWRAPVVMGVSRPEQTPRSLLSNYLSTFFLTLANPATILSFALIFASTDVVAGTAGNRWGGLLLVAGVFCGSGLWWFLLSGGVSLVRGRLTPAGLQWVNRAAGLLIATFALFLFWRLLTS